MSDSDDDYMSDKFLPDSNNTDDIRPSLLFNSTLKRSHSIYKKQVEYNNKKPKTRHEREEEQRTEGLNKAITSDNIGFKLLQKMGYSEGKGLGRSGEGIKTPINITLKNNSTGLGVETRKKEIAVKKKVYKENILKWKEDEFRTHNLQKNTSNMLRREYFKAQRICEELDEKADISEPVEDFFWTKDAITKLRGEKDDDVSSDDDLDVEPSEEKLVSILDYLRSMHLYCLYCAFKAEDKGDLERNCPGPYRLDHEDDI